MGTPGWALSGNQLTTNDSVGIGTNAPATKLHVEGSSDQDATIALERLDNGKFVRLGVGGSGVTLEIDSTSFLTVSNNQGLGIGGNLVGTELLRVTADGKLGVGTAAPKFRLDVADQSAGMSFFDALGVAVLYLKAGSLGSAALLLANNQQEWHLQISRDGTLRLYEAGTSNSYVGFGTDGGLTVTGDVVLTGADCAEDFDRGDEPVEPGTVVVIDEKGSLQASQEPYDKKVAGVVSGAGEYKHGLLLDKQSSDKDRIPVALVGKVYCKVDANYSPIEVGDLLTTSPTRGHAMKAAEHSRAFGSVIGKALTALPAGQALIPILVALQ